MANRVLATLARLGLLLGLSMALVFGFWIHGEFYQYGLYTLLLVGGFVTFLVIQGFRLALSGEMPRGRPRGEMTFTLEEGDRILRNAATLAVRPVDFASSPSVGDHVRARYETGPEFGRLLIVDASRAFLADLTEEDARGAGYRTAADLLEAGRSRWAWKPEDVVSIVRFRRLGVRG